MFLFSSPLLLFLFIAFVVLAYHFFFWNNDLSGWGVRPWLGGFECGFIGGRVSECYFSYTYFVLLVFFVVFDLEVSLLLNVPYGFCYFKSSLCYLFFLLSLGLSYMFELYGGYVRWSY